MDVQESSVIYVYCVGEVDYDVRVELPTSVHRTLEGAQAAINGVKQWREVGDHEWEGEAGSSVYAIQRYEVDP